MGDEKNSEKDFECPHCKKEAAISKNEKSNGGEITKDEEKSLTISEKDDWNFSLFGEETETEKKEEKRESRIFIYTSDFIGSDLRRRVSFDSVKESSKP